MQSSPDNWIVATVTGQGSWYDDRASAVSAINSHIASRKSSGKKQSKRSFDKAQASQRERRDHPPLSLVSHVHDDVVGQEESDHWSLTEVDEIFGQAQPSEAASSNTASILSIEGFGNTLHEEPQHTPTCLHMRRRPQRQEPEPIHKSGALRNANRRYLQTFDLMLSPSMTLPIEVSAHEKSLLHFYLTEGRRTLLGTIANPAYCPALHVAQQGALERSSAYVQTHIAMAEYILCKLRTSSLTATFYRRRAEAYKTVSDLLLNPDAEFDEVLCGLVTLQMAEFTIGQKELQNMHLKAMHQLVEKRGGSDFFLLDRDPKHAMMEPMFYSNQFLFASSPEFDDHTLVVDSFISNLVRIRDWVRGDSYTKSVDLDISTFFQTFLKSADTNVDNRRLGAFLFAFTLCLTYVEFELTHAASKDFLQSVQDYLIQSISTTGTGGDTLDCHPCVAVATVSHMRRKLLRKVNRQRMSNKTRFIHMNLDIEVLISESFIHAAKIFPKLSIYTQSRLSRTLLACTLTAIKPTMAEGLSEADLKDLKHEICKDAASS